MKGPNCPHHGKLVLDLALGRLGDADAAAAELHRDSCPLCAGWWNETFGDHATSQVDAAVRRGFAEFSPVAGRRRAWLAAVAAVVIAVVVGTATLLWRSDETTPIVAQKRAPAGAVVSTFDFEGGTLAPTTEASTAPTSGARRDAGESVFSNDLESGDLGSWTFHS